MSRKKILLSILAGLSLCLFVGINATAVENNSSSNSSSYCKYVDINDIEGFEKVDILGSMYDLSLVNPAVVQSAIRTFDEINTGNLSEDDKNKKLKDIKEMLDEYFKDPEKFENFPVTLDLGPSSLLREEIKYVQDKIKELKDEQESIKKTKMEQRAIDEKVQELQNEINNLSRWVNYSVVNFNSSKYETTFCDILSLDSSVNVEENLGENVEVLLSSVYVTSDYEDLFRVFVNSNGEFTIEGSEISDADLLEIIKKNLEFENLKVRNLLEEIKAVENSKIAEIEQEKQIKQLKREIESVKAYGLSQEIILLNLERDALEKTKISIEFMEERINEIDKKISEKLESLKDFKLNFENNPEYVVKNSDLGKTSSYFGYVLQDENGFGVKVFLDENNKVLIDNIKLAGVENVTLDVLTSDQKDILKKVVEENISKSKESITKLEMRKSEFEAKSDDDTKYYLIDAISKELSVLNNDIKNYEIILSQI